MKCSYTMYIGNLPDKAWVNNGVLLLGVSCPFVKSTRNTQTKDTLVT